MADCMGKYLYCIVRPSPERVFDDVTPVGKAPGPVHMVCRGGLAAVVSDSPAAQYECTRTNMLAHQGVQERVMQELTILPVRFGTVADSGSPARQIHKLLEIRSREFHRLFSEMEGKVELGLKALWRDEKTIFQEVLAENPDIRRLRNSLAGRPPAALRLEAVPLGHLVKEALGRKKAQESAAILARFRPLAVQVRENQAVMDRMVLNAAFLVEKGREAEFDRAVSGLDTELGHRTLFKYVGPVPPYNFVNITVNWHELEGGR